MCSSITARAQCACHAVRLAASPCAGAYCLLGPAGPWHCCSASAAPPSWLPCPAAPASRRRPTGGRAAATAWLSDAAAASLWPAPAAEPAARSFRQVKSSRMVTGNHDKKAHTAAVHQAGLQLLAGSRPHEAMKGQAEVGQQQSMRTCVKLVSPGIAPPTVALGPAGRTVKLADSFLQATWTEASCSLADT